MQAITLDPNFAAAYGQAAWCFCALKGNSWRPLRQQDIAETERLARLALALGRDDAVATGLAGHALALVVHDLDAGAACLERALALNPNHAPNWYFGGIIQVWLGHSDVAIDHLKRAMRLSPLDGLISSMETAIAHAHYFAARYDEAHLWASKALKDRPDWHPALRIGTAAAAMASHPATATRLRLRLQEVDPGLRPSTLGDVEGPYRGPDQLTRYAEGLRKAGLPE